MKLLLFGGTFDPPHNGHMCILKNAIQTVQPDKVIVMPDNIPPHKNSGDTPALLRLAMCQCFEPLHKNLTVSDMEIKRGGASYSYFTVQQLQKVYPKAHIYMCIGSDMLITFTQWKNWQFLLAQVTLVVQLRENSDIPAFEAARQSIAAQGAHIILAQGAIKPMASRDLRQAIAQGEDVSAQIPPKAWQVIQEYNLYRSTFGIPQAKKLAKQMLKPKRYIHVGNVAKAARELALLYGESPARAELAAWLHDIVKEYADADLLQLLNEDAIIAGSTVQRPSAIWHGPAAAIFANKWLGITDADILTALHCHTTGRVGMSRLDKIVYLADKISEERTYNGVQQVRLLAKQNLNAAVAETMRQSIEYTQSKGHPVDEESLAALAALQNEIA